MAESAPSELVDIIAPWMPPPAPPPYGWIALGVGIALLVVLGIGYFLWQRNRKRRAALTQLKQAERALRRQKLEPRAAAFQAAQALHRAYGKSTFGDNTQPWATFLSALDQARYAPHTPTAQEAAQLLEQARHWLRRAPC